LPASGGGHGLRLPPAESLYDIFRPPGGMVICLENDGYAGRSRYCPALLIPPEWQRFVAPAVEFWHAHQEFVITGGRGAAPDRVELRRLAEDANPLVAGIAFRDLARADEIETADAIRLTANADRLRQAVFAVALLRNAPEAFVSKPYPRDYDDRPAKLKERIGGLVGAVLSAKDFADVNGIGIAALVRYEVPPAHDPKWEGGADLAAQLLKKAAGSARLSPQDAELVAALGKCIAGGKKTRQPP
jgi:hypothetical protein